MQHHNVIENFINHGTGGRGTYLKADDRMLYSQFPANYSPWGHRMWGAPAGRTIPVAVRLNDGKILVNGARINWPAAGYQTGVLNTLRLSSVPFGVVPFHSIVAAWTDGKDRDWDRAPLPIPELQDGVEVAVPSGGERWRQVTEQDKHGRPTTRQVHTLGDSVVRIRDRYYLSAVDETGIGGGMYFLAELPGRRAPRSLGEAFDFLKPQVVRDAEANGKVVKRQGEWFAVPTNHLTSELMRDVARGIAVYRRNHVLGKDGHHELEEAVIYRVGARKGEVYARGVLRHTGNEHHDLDLGAVRWHLVVHNIQGASYTLSGSAAQFD
jgi:hypothetical protein